MKQSKEPMPLDDAALEEYLRGDSSVSRHYRSLPDEAPPPALDQQVLAQARAALGAKPVARRPRWVRWGAPMAVAASAVMALSIMMQGGLQQAEVTSPVPMAEQAPAPAVVEDRAVAVQAAPEQEVISATSDAAPPPPPAVPENAAPMQARQQAAEQPVQQMRRLDVDEVVREKSQVKSAPARATSNAVAPASAVRADAPQATQSVRPAMPAPAAVPAPPPQPEDWLSEIRRLRLEGEVQQADSEWQGFRAAYPDYVVTDADPARPAGCSGSC